MGGVDPRVPGPDLPTVGRSLFDHLVGTDPVPFPLETLLLIVVTLASLLGWRFLQDEPMAYAEPSVHFNYGSTGGERNWGFPYWVWKALPAVWADHLPGEGYESLGMIFEPGRRQEPDQGRLRDPGRGGAAGGLKVRHP